MTENEAIQKSLEHWQRMYDARECLKDIDKFFNKASYITMFKEIDETWSVGYCSLCKEYTCDKCPINIKCNDEGSAWRKVFYAKNYEEWCIAALEMIALLKGLLIKLYTKQ